LQAIADEFTELTGVEIEIIDNNFFEISTNYPVVADSSEGPDLLLIQNSDLGTLVEADSIRPISIVDEEFAGRFAPVATEAFAYGGKNYGVGLTADGYGIVYNKALVSEVPGTWSEFFNLAEELTLKDGIGNITQYGFLVNPTSYWFIYPLVERYGGYYFGRNADGSFNPDDLGVANDGSVQAFTELLALKEKGLTTMTAEEDESTINQLFAEGKVGMMIYSLWYTDMYKENGIDYGYVPLPNNDDGTPSRPLGSVLGVVANAYSQYPDEADAFLKYMMTDENLQRLYEAANGGDAKNGQRNTVNLSVFQSEYVQSDANLKTLAEIGLSSQVFPSNPEATVIWSYYKQAFDNIFYNGMPVKDTLKELETALKKDIATIRGQ
jgi:arabinogalactan oligomer/maltooligosaccharide transport system substrate-binding protein